jgi:predicted DNA-binding protein (UPF0251 family)
MWVYTHLEKGDSMSPFRIKKRYCRIFGGATYFKPRGVPLRKLQINELALDELEAVHLCDYEDFSQAEAAEKMKISSSTLQRLLYSGRRMVIDALYKSKAISISKPNQVCEYDQWGNGYRGRGRCRCGRKLRRSKK